MIIVRILEVGEIKKLIYQLNCLQFKHEKDINILDRVFLTISFF
jgi:hypothetical protein